MNNRGTQLPQRLIFHWVQTDNLPCWAGLWCCDGESHHQRQCGCVFAEEFLWLRAKCLGYELPCAAAEPGFADVSCWTKRAPKTESAAVWVTNSKTRCRGSSESDADDSGNTINHLQMCLCMNFPVLKCSRDPAILQELGKHPLECDGSWLQAPQFPGGVCHHFPTLKLVEHALQAAKC